MVEHQMRELGREFYGTCNPNHIPGYELMMNPQAKPADLEGCLKNYHFYEEFNKTIKNKPEAYSLLGVTDDFIDIFCVKAEDPTSDRIRTTAFNQFLDSIGETIDTQRRQYQKAGKDYQLDESEIRSLAVFFRTANARLESFRPSVLEGKTSEIDNINSGTYSFLNTGLNGKNRLLIENSSGGQRVITEIEEIQKTIKSLIDWGKMRRETWVETQDIIAAGQHDELPDSSDVEDTLAGVDAFLKNKKEDNHTADILVDAGGKPEETVTDMTEKQIQDTRQYLDTRIKRLNDRRKKFNPRNLKYYINNLINTTTELHIMETGSEQSGWTPKQKLTHIQTIRKIYGLAIAKINATKNPGKFLHIWEKYSNEIKRLKAEEKELSKNIGTIK